MSYRATLSCDQPNCTTSLTASVDQIDFTLRLGKWKVEETEQGISHTCRGHEPGVVLGARRRRAGVVRHLLLELRELDEDGYYVTGVPADGGGALLHVHPYEGEDDSGPFVSIEQLGRSFHARLYAGDGGPVVFDEDDWVWD